MVHPIDHTLHTYTGRYYSHNHPTAEHLTVQHPVDLTPFTKGIPKLRSVKFDFSRSAFKPKGFDQFEQIKQVLTGTKLTRLTIQGSKYLERLPDILKSHPIRQLKIINCSALTNIANILPYLEELVDLEIIGAEMNIGNRIPFLPKLERLYLKLDKVSSLQHLSFCSRLSWLELQSLTIETLPDDIEKLKQLKIVKLWQLSNLTALPRFSGEVEIEELHLVNLPALKNFADGFPVLPSLKVLRIQNVGNVENSLELPTTLFDAENLENILIAHCQLKEIPKNISSLKKLTNLGLGNLPITELPESIGDLDELSILQITNCPALTALPKTISNLNKLIRFNFTGLSRIEKIEGDYSNLASLKNVNITYCENLESIDESLAKNISVEVVRMTDLPVLKVLPPFGKLNINLRKLDIERTPSLEKISETIVDIDRLEQLNLMGLGLEELPVPKKDDWSNLEQLHLVLPKLKYIPVEYFYPSSLFRFNFHSDFAELNRSVYQVHELYPRIKKSAADQDVKEAIYFWLGNNHEHFPITKTIKINTFLALSSKIKLVDMMILPKLHFFNSNKKPFVITEIKSGAKVWINGAITGNKTIMKNKIKELGFKVVNKFSEDVQLIIVGKKPTIPEGIFEGERWFAPPIEMEEILKTENPGLLQTDDISPDFILNLQQLLWSDDAQNHGVALELVKANGLPESVEDDFLYVSKTCQDKKIKNRIRTFLKSKLSEEKQKAMSVGSAYFRIEKLAYTLPRESMANLYFAEYKRTNVPNLRFYYYANATHPRRKDFLYAAMSKLAENPRYIKQHGIKLLEEEWNLLFSQDVFKGHLRRIVGDFSHCEKLPEALLEHIDSLKVLELTIGDKFDIGSFYQLTKLTQLKLNAINENRERAGFDTIPEGISQLKRLSTLYLYGSEKIKMPKDLGELKKLKTIYCYPGIANKSDFEGVFPEGVLM